MKKWCCFRCLKCEEKKEKGKSFRACEKCAMTKIDPSKSYSILSMTTHYLQDSNNNRFEIPSDFVQYIHSTFNSNQQPIISASTPVYSVGGASLPCPQQYLSANHVTAPNYVFPSTSPFGSLIEAPFCNPSDYETPYAELVNDNFQNKSHYIMMSTRDEQPQPNAQDNISVSTLSNYNLPSSYGMND
ncbi:hypothetical protein F8M41_013340 [Gigaspora margarita]|uniref:Uncharacterized protein n=1 Tax=Gigaspora margarita TaxID=4874 RepID=A0A8H3WX58_GIGMA|nr:hypothetical protein F8M41_013340 [Gigaspora margarita]